MEIAEKNIANIFWVICWVVLIPVVAYICAIEVKYSLLMLGSVIGLTLAGISIVNYRAGYYIALTVGLTIRLLERIGGTEFSVGIVIDALLLATLLGSFFKPGDKSIQKVNFFRDPLLITFYIYAGFILIEFFNPNIANRFGWSTFTRVFIRDMCFMYLTIKMIRNIKDLKFFFKFWIVLLTLAALYACMQQWFGLMPFEKAFIAKYPYKYKTVILLTGIRIFSFMSDPAALGLVLACGIIINIILLTSSDKILSLTHRILLVISLVFQSMALGFTGTRTAYVMVPIGLVMMLLANLRSKNAIIGSFAFSVAFLVIMFGPFYNNPTVVRIRSAFSTTNDASMNVRVDNRHRMQPYIYSHPLGGGLMSCEPGSGGELEGFPPDSGLLRTALERGWIGLVLELINLFLVLQYAVSCYFNSKTEEEKQLTLIIVCVLFALVVSMYAQEASGLLESALLFYGLNGIVIKLKYLTSTNISS